MHGGVKLPPLGPSVVVHPPTPTAPGAASQGQAAGGGGQNIAGPEHHSHDGTPASPHPQPQPQPQQRAELALFVHVPLPDDALPPQHQPRRRSSLTSPPPSADQLEQYRSFVVASSAPLSPIQLGRDSIQSPFSPPPESTHPHRAASSAAETPSPEPRHHHPIGAPRATDAEPSFTSPHIAQRRQSSNASKGASRSPNNSPPNITANGAAGSTISTKSDTRRRRSAFNDRAMLQRARSLADAMDGGILMAATWVESGFIETEDAQDMEYLPTSLIPAPIPFQDDSDDEKSSGDDSRSVSSSESGSQASVPAPDGEDDNQVHQCLEDEVRATHYSRTSTPHLPGDEAELLHMHISGASSMVSEVPGVVLTADELIMGQTPDVDEPSRPFHDQAQHYAVHEADVRHANDIYHHHPQQQQQEQDQAQPSHHHHPHHHSHHHAHGPKKTHEQRRLEYFQVPLQDIKNRLHQSKTYRVRTGGKELLLEDYSFTVHPSGEFNKRWETVVVVLLLYVAIVTPVDIAFFGTDTDFTLITFNRVVDCLLAVDMLVNMSMMYIDHRNMWETRWWMCALHYVQRWFLIDIISIFPFSDVIIAATAGGNFSQLRMLRIVRLSRLFKLFRIVRASRILRRFEATTDMSSSMQSLLFYIVLVLVVVHWMACVYHLGPALEDPAVENWVQRAGLQDGNAWDWYAASALASTLCLAVGAPNDLPATSIERALIIFMNMIAGSLYAYVIGQVTNILVNMDPAGNEYRTCRDMLSIYCDSNKIYGDLRLRVQEYFQTSEAVFKAKFFTKILGLMSPALRQEVAMHVHGPWLSQIPFFNPPNPTERAQFVSAIAMQLQEVLFAPKEVIIRSGEPAKCMYVVKSGLIARLGRVFGRGRFVGEDIILKNSRRKYTVRTLTYVSAQQLQRAQLLEILGDNRFPQTQALIHRAAIRLSMRREVTRIADSMHNAGLLQSLRGTGRSSANLLASIKSLAPKQPPVFEQGMNVRDTEPGLGHLHRARVLALESKTDQIVCAMRGYRKLVQDVSRGNRSMFTEK